MNVMDPWISDLRRNQQVSISRTGLPALPQYSLRSFRQLVGKIWVTFLLSVAAVSVLYCSKILSGGDGMNMRPKAANLNGAQQVSKIKMKGGDVEKRSDVVVMSDHPEAHSILANLVPSLDLFYLTRPNHVTCSTKRHVIGDHFRCRFRNQSRVFDELGLSVDPRDHPSPRKECLEENFCFRKENAPLLCKKEFCGFRTRDPSDSPCAGCGRVDATALSRKCRASSVRMIGVTSWSCDADCLRRLVSQQNVKIVKIECASCLPTSKYSDHLLPSCPSYEKLDGNPLDDLEYLAIRLEDLREASSSVVMEMLGYAGGSDLSPRQGDHAIKRRRKREIGTGKKRRRLRHYARN